MTKKLKTYINLSFFIFEERSLYYAFDRFCKNYNLLRELMREKEGAHNRYSSLRAIYYALNILGYDHFDDEDALRVLELYDPVRLKKLKRDLIKIGYFELKKSKAETENLRQWQKFFLTGQVSEDARHTCAARQRQ